jgi:preprotein translocase SecE subunit
MWSAVGYGCLVSWFAYFMWDKLSVLDLDQYTQVVQVGAAVFVLAVFGLLGYWVLGLNKRVNDFLIATEGEMKKVNWTSRKEIIGSTKVVIVVVVSMSVLLFVVDIFFMGFFTAIGVLKGAGFLDVIKESF